MKRIVTKLAFDFKKINDFFISWKVHWYKNWIQIRILVISTYKNVLTLLNFPTWPKYFRRQNKPYQEFIREKVMAIKKSYLIPKNFKILLLKQQVFALINEAERPRIEFASGILFPHILACFKDFLAGRISTTDQVSHTSRHYKFLIK